MRWWQPEPGEPELFDWWRPLLRASHRARIDEVPWPIYIDEFKLAGRIDRASRPPIWGYVHRRTDGELLVDDDGATYEFVRYRRGPQLGRFKEIGLRHAIWRARLPEVVEPIWYDEPTPQLVDDASGNHFPTAEDVRERRHLRLVSPPA